MTAKARERATHYDNSNDFERATLCDNKQWA